jgi:hypothetical protein
MSSKLVEPSVGKSKNRRRCLAQLFRHGLLEDADGRWHATQSITGDDPTQ